MKLIASSIILSAIFMCSGCTQTKYAWNNYDQHLYDYYKEPTELDHFTEHLKEIIEAGDEDGRIPPGLYAEYGYVLYEKGNLQDAILYFQKEQNKWPESKVLMAKMISNAQKRVQQKNKPPEQPASRPQLDNEVGK